MNKKNCENLKINFLFFRNPVNKNTQLSKNPETTRTLKAQSSQTIRHQEKEKIKHKSITQQEQLKSFRNFILFYFLFFKREEHRLLDPCSKANFTNKSH
jgi:hypothetical protein